MTFDKDLQRALIRNQQVDSQLREMQSLEKSSQFQDELQDIEFQSKKNSSNLEDELQYIDNASRNQEDLQYTDIQSSKNDSEVQDNVYDMALINRKIREYTTKLKFWMDKKKQWQERQGVINANNELKSVQVTVNDFISAPPEKDNTKGFHKKSSRTFNEYYERIEETKDQIMHSLGDGEYNNPSGSEEDVPKELDVNMCPKQVDLVMSPKSATPRSNHNEESNVLKNRKYLTQVPKKSHTQVIKDNSIDKTSPNDDVIEIDHYDEEDYSSRDFWRQKSNMDTVMISDDEKETHSDIEEGKMPMSRKKATKKSTIMKDNLDSNCDNGKSNNADSDVQSESNSDESLPDIPPDSETNSHVSQPYLDSDGNMVLPPLIQQLIDDQQGPPLTGWERAADFQMLNLLKLMPKADFAANKWQWIACRMQNYTFSNSQVANHVCINCLKDFFWSL